MRMSRGVFLVITLALLASGCASTGNAVQTLNIADAKASRYGDRILPSVPVFFNTGDGEIIEAGLVSRRSSAILRDEDYSRASGIAQGCYRAFTTAVQRLQRVAKKRGASKVIHLKSAVGGTTARAADTFLCRVGAARVSVYLSGDLAR